MSFGKAKQPAVLALEDGLTFKGHAFGAEGEASGEVVFNTSMIGYQEILTTTLTNPESLFTKMKRPKTPLVELTNPKVATMTCLRSWLLPSIMEFFSNNQSVEFPQKIFELGKVTHLDETKETKTRDEEWLSAATTHANANFTEIKSSLDAFFCNFGVQWQIKENKRKLTN